MWQVHERGSYSSSLIHRDSGVRADFLSEYRLPSFWSHTNFRGGTSFSASYMANMEEEQGEQAGLNSGSMCILALLGNTRLWKL